MQEWWVGLQHHVNKDREEVICTGNHFLTPTLQHSLLVGVVKERMFVMSKCSMSILSLPVEVTLVTVFLNLRI